MGMAVESAAGTAGQRIVQIHPTKPDGGDFHVQLTVDPATSGFVAMRMLGKFGEMRFTVTETIKSLAKLSDECGWRFCLYATGERYESGQAGRVAVLIRGEYPRIGTGFDVNHSIRKEQVVL